MNPREAAEKRELELALDYFAKRALSNAGDAAELKEAFEAAAKEIADLKAQIPAPETPADDPNRQARGIMGEYNNLDALRQANQLA